MDVDHVRLLDELCANATMASTVQLVDGWLLRATPDAPFHRANSVLPLADDGTRVDERIALVESFYRSRGLPVQFLISPAAHPPALDAVLEARGYVEDTPTRVQVAVLDPLLLETGGGAPGIVTIDPGIEAGWLADYADTFADKDPVLRARVAAYGRMLPRLGPDTGAARLVIEGATVGIGLVVTERRWAGLYAMGVRPEMRRRRGATGLLHSLALWAAERGATRAYLQVEAHNLPAVAFYARAGFQHAYEYHYRLLQ